jgi:hypothetical protein
VGLLISLLIFKKNTFSLLTVLVNEYAPEALAYLSQHLLGVSALCEDVTEAIQSLTFRLRTVIDESILKRNVNDETQMDDPSLSSLRSLHRYIVDYFQWLRSLKGSLVKLCRVFEVVHCVHPSLRFVFFVAR